MQRVIKESHFNRNKSLSILRTSGYDSLHIISLTSYIFALFPFFYFLLHHKVSNISGIKVNTLSLPFHLIANLYLAPSFSTVFTVMFIWKLRYIQFFFDYYCVTRSCFYMFRSIHLSHKLRTVIKFLTQNFYKPFYCSTTMALHPQLMTLSYCQGVVLLDFFFANVAGIW